MIKIHTIIFDMDGVLIAAGDWHYEALNRALQEHGYEPITYDDHLTQFDGLPTRKKLELIQCIPMDRYPAIHQAKQRHTLDIIRERCEPRPEHSQMLAQFTRDGYTLALCSNCVRETIHLILELSKLSSHFNLVLSYEDVGAPKPDPLIYTHAMRTLHTSSKATLILEDNPKGLAAAYAAAAHVMRIMAITDVTYANIKAHIERIESGTP